VLAVLPYQLKDVSFQIKVGLEYYPDVPAKTINFDAKIIIDCVRTILIKAVDRRLEFMRSRLGSPEKFEQALVRPIDSISAVLLAQG